MNWESWMQSKAVADLGWTLFHSTWQISFVSAALYAALKVIPGDATRLRYGLCVAALTINGLLPAVTFVQYSSPAAPFRPQVSDAWNASYGDPHIRANYGGFDPSVRSAQGAEAENSSV